MRKLLASLAILLVILGAAFLLLSRSGADSAPFALASSDALLAGLRQVQGEPEWIALLPGVKSLRAALRTHPVTRARFLEWQESRDLGALRYVPGDFDLVAWRSGGSIQYAVRMSALQQVVVRTASRFSRDIPELRRDGDWLTTDLTAKTTAGARLSPDVLHEITELADGRKGRAFVFVPAADPRSSDTEPGANLLLPGGKASVVVATLETDRLTLTSRSRAASTSLAGLRSLRHPNGAFLSVKFGKVPHAIGELEKLARVKISRLMEKGSMVALYKVDSRKLVPKIHGVIVVPADAARSAELAGVVETLIGSAGSGLERLLGGSRRRSERDGPGGVHVIRLETLGSVLEYGFPPGEVVVSFDKSSMDHYLEDRAAPVAAPPSGEDVAWTLKADHDLLGRVAKVGESDAVRLFAPEVSRRIGELTQLTRSLPVDATLKATSTLSGAYEEISVVVAAK